MFIICMYVDMYACVFVGREKERECSVFEEDFLCSFFLKINVKCKQSNNMRMSKYGALFLSCYCYCYHLFTYSLDKR